MSWKCLRSSMFGFTWLAMMFLSWISSSSFSFRLEIKQSVCIHVQQMLAVKLIILLMHFFLLLNCTKIVWLMQKNKKICHWRKNKHFIIIWKQVINLSTIFASQANMAFYLTYSLLSPVQPSKPVNITHAIYLTTIIYMMFNKLKPIYSIWHISESRMSPLNCGSVLCSGSPPAVSAVSADSLTVRSALSFLLPHWPHELEPLKQCS